MKSSMLFVLYQHQSDKLPVHHSADIERQTTAPVGNLEWPIDLAPDA